MPTGQPAPLSRQSERVPDGWLWPALATVVCGGLAILVLRFPVTLDGPSHVYGAHALWGLLTGDRAYVDVFTRASPLLPNWTTPLLLMVLTRVLSANTSLALCTIFAGTASVWALYSCAFSGAAARTRNQKSQALLIVLPVGLSTYVVYGFLGFLISSAICFLVIGRSFRLRNLEAPGIGTELTSALLLLLAYWSHPLPVVLGLLYVLCWLGSQALIVARTPGADRVASFSTLARRLWPWLPAALLVAAFSQHPITPDLAPSAEPFFGMLKSRILALTIGEGALAIAPTQSGASLFLGLVGLLAYGAFSGRETAQARGLRPYVVALLVAFLFVPDSVAGGSGISTRILFAGLAAMTVMAVAQGPFLSRHYLTTAALLAAMYTVVFAGEYALVSRRLAPAVAELAEAVSVIPPRAKVLVLSYRLTPQCGRWGLLDKVKPERHWALLAATGRNLIVLNDYESARMVFPVQNRTDGVAAIVDEYTFTDKAESAWTSALSRTDPDSFVISWGAPNGGGTCPSTPEPLVDVLARGYDRVYSRSALSAISIWKKRAAR